MVGGGRALPLYQTLAGKLGIDQHVVFMGPVTDIEKKVSLYRHCLCFVLSSNQEGLGIVAIEAAAAGAPIVSTDCGGIVDIVVDGVNGYRVKKEDARQLADAQHRIITNKRLRSRLSGNAKRVANQRFSTTAFAKQCKRYGI